MKLKNRTRSGTIQPIDLRSALLIRSNRAIATFSRFCCVILNSGLKLKGLSWSLVPPASCVMLHSDVAHSCTKRSLPQPLPLILQPPAKPVSTVSNHFLWYTLEPKSFGRRVRLHRKASGNWEENGLLPRVIIKGQPTSGFTIAERMTHYRVPGVSAETMRRLALNN